MSQIKHEIRVTNTDIVQAGGYHFDFTDYTSFTARSPLYKNINNLLYVNLPMVYGQFYRFKRATDDYGLLQVVNIQRALGFINMYVSIGNREHLQSAIIIERSIRNSAHKYENGLYLYNDFYQPLYMLEKNWLSGMAQGQYSSLCILLFKHTNNKEYIAYADSALRVMLLPLEEGGCATKLNSQLWFEEYVKNGRPSFVLNGNVFSILGLYDYCCVTSNHNSELVSSVSCLLDNTELFFSFKNVSRYDLRESICDSSYNRLHVIQYQVLSRVFSNQKFELLSRRFEALSSEHQLPLSFILKKNLWRLVKLWRFFVN